MKNDLQKVYKWVSLFPENLTLAALGALLVPQPVFYTKNEPTAPPKCPQAPKITQKINPKVEQLL